MLGMLKTEVEPTLADHLVTVSSPDSPTSQSAWPIYQAIKNSRVEFVQGDLFAQFTNNQSAVTHAVAADMALGKGLALLVKKRFPKLVQQLKTEAKTQVAVGDVVVQPTVEGGGVRSDFLFHLVTKKVSRGYPTLADFKLALTTLFDSLVEYGFKKVAMPKIGMGLDRLKAVDVLAALDEQIERTGVDVVMIYL